MMSDNVWIEPPRAPWLRPLANLLVSWTVGINKTRGSRYSLIGLMVTLVAQSHPHAIKAMATASNWGHRLKCVELFFIACENVPHAMLARVGMARAAQTAPPTQLHEYFASMSPADVAARYPAHAAALCVLDWHAIADVEDMYTLPVVASELLSRDDEMPPDVIEQLIPRVPLGCVVRYAIRRGMAYMPGYHEDEMASIPKQIMLNLVSSNASTYAVNRLASTQPIAVLSAFRTLLKHAAAGGTSDMPPTYSLAREMAKQRIEHGKGVISGCTYIQVWLGSTIYPLMVVFVAGRKRVGADGRTTCSALIDGAERLGAVDLPFAEKCPTADAALLSTTYSLTLRHTPKLARMLSKYCCLATRHQAMMLALAVIYGTPCD